MTLLHRPYDRTGLTLRNRIAMAPMTRSRAIGNVPNALMADYYRQRAGAGLVITEGTASNAWIVDAAGRIGHPDNLPRGATLLAPSAVAAAGTIWTDANGPQPHPVPKAMDADDIARVRGAFADSAVLARAAGADGVELHAANGYLLAQFLNPRSNVRTDGYGGSAGNRRRFVLETVDATVGAIGAARVGIRLSPFNPYNDLEAGYDGERDEFLALVDALATRGLAYLHLGGGTVDDALLAEVRARWTGTLIVNGGYDAARAEAVLEGGLADLVAFGAPFIANPDLPDRLRLGLPLAAPDPATFFSADARGYTDWPAAA